MSLTTLLSLESTWVFSAETNCSWQQISDCQWEVLLLFSIYLSFWILSHVSLGEEYLTKFTGNSSTIQLHYCWASTSLTHIFPKFLFSKRRLNTWNCFFFFLNFWPEKFQDKNKSHILFFWETYIAWLGKFLNPSPFCFFGRENPLAASHRCFQDPPRNIRLGTFGAIVLRGSTQRCPQKSRV